MTREAERLIERAEAIALTKAHRTLREADAVTLHEAVSGAVMEAIAPLWRAKEDERAGKRQAYYLSAEYLVGRMVYNNLYATGLLEEVRELLAARGADLAALEDIEDDAFGNGGLGRLAACFLDSAATHGIPLTGYGLRYRYGLFRQTFADFRQHEEPDDWSRFGDPWSVRRLDRAVVVEMKTGNVLAVPYDMPVIGYGARNVATLRLWQCESLHEIDFGAFNDQRYAQASADKNRAEDITKFLYPNDPRRAGKQMRVRQQYVLVSASLQDMIRSYRERHGRDWSHFAAEHAVQLNDTHPVMAIPELIRLMEKDGVPFEEALAVARETFSYTNHTVMQEALEKWDLSLLRSVCPGIVEVMRRIDAAFRAEMRGRGLPVLPTRCVIDGKRVHMAQLAVYASHATNGVSRLHTQILKDTVFADWYAVWPERFVNVTNGVTPRRWLGLCNPELTELFARRIGDGFLTDLDRLGRLKPMIDHEMCEAFRAVKRLKKEQLCSQIARREGVTLDPDWMFDVQIKRLHEYKRQLMNALSVIALWQGMRKGEFADFAPTVFLFGAKAAPGYVRAKSIIRLINMAADRIDRDPAVSGRLKIVFVQNYDCSWAEKIIPAADVSEQISPAGTEASGTGNMKLMLNGAVTLGTWDGANAEIFEEAGRENNCVFGASVEELDAIRASYDPKEICASDALLRGALDTLVDGTFEDADGGLKELYDSLLEGASWHRPDHYFVLRDFRPYLEAKLAVNREYAEDPEGFARKCLVNAASAGRFSSDRTLAEYARDIWRL